MTRALRDDAAPTDEVLLAGIGRGDTHALAALYLRYAAGLRGLARRVLRDRAEAEDVVHDAFLACRDRAARFDAHRGAAGAWLSTMVRHLAIDRLRSRQRRRRLRRDRVACEPPPATPSVEALAVDVQEGAALRRAMTGLPGVQRETLEEAFFEGLTYTEIAARHGVPIGTIKSRAKRAMEGLRLALRAS
jgi:RNA polymerase sigma-70 factor (ECF subfamily)